MESVEKSGHVKQGVRDGGRRVKAHLDTGAAKAGKKREQEKGKKVRGN